MAAKSSAGWNKDSTTPLPPSGLNVNMTPSGLPAVQVTACDSPASISPIRSSVVESVKSTTNGHIHAGVYSSPHAHYQSSASTGDLNDNLIDHHHNNGIVHPSTTSTQNGHKNGGDQHHQQQQRISSSSSTPVSSSSSSAHPLFLFGVCRWPGCESPCDDLNSFIE